METCLFRNKQICSFELRDESGFANTSLEKEWRLAGQKGELKCEDCNDEVILKFGPIKIPHFAHKFDTKRKPCYYRSYPESEDHREAKWLIYNYLKDCYDSETIHVNYKCFSGIRCDFMIERPNNHKVVVELQRLELKTKEWERKNKIYRDNNIFLIWILFGKQLKNYSFTDLRYFERLNLLDNQDNILRIIDTASKTLTLLKEINWKNPKTGQILNRTLFSKSYNLIDRQAPKGNILKDFLQSYQEKKMKFEKECETEALLAATYHQEMPLDDQVPNHKELINEVPEDKWGVCEICGERTNEWWDYDGKTGTCKCNKCKKK